MRLIDEKREKEKDAAIECRMKTHFFERCLALLNNKIYESKKCGDATDINSTFTSDGSTLIFRDGLEAKVGVK